MRCFVTGGSGFVGRHLTTFLRRKGLAVSGIAGRRPADGLAGCDLRHARKLTDLLSSARPDRVFHLAAFSNPQDSRRRPRDCYDINVQGTINVLDAVRRTCPGARVVLAGTCQVYRSGAQASLREDAPLAPNSPYAGSKKLAEDAALDFARLYGVKAVLTRSFNHAGPGQSDRYVLSDFCRQIAEREGLPEGKVNPLQVGNPSAVRDFLDVRDVVRAYAALAEKGREGEVYNVCSALPVSIAELLRLCFAESAAPLSYRVRSERLRPGEADRIVGDNSKLMRDTGWKAEIPLRRTVIDVLDDWRRRLVTPASTI